MTDIGTHAPGPTLPSRRRGSQARFRFPVVRRRRPETTSAFRSINASRKRANVDGGIDSAPATCSLRTPSTRSLSIRRGTTRNARNERGGAVDLKAAFSLRPPLGTTVGRFHGNRAITREWSAASLPRVPTTKSDVVGAHRPRLKSALASSGSESNYKKSMESMANPEPLHLTFMVAFNIFSYKSSDLVQEIRSS